MRLTRDLKTPHDDTTYKKILEMLEKKGILKNKGDIKMNNYEDALDDICCGCNSFEDKKCHVEKMGGKKCESYIALKELVDKATPKKPIDRGFIDDVLQYRCPICKKGNVGKLIDNGWKIKGTGFTNYCPHCGQKIDWSEDDE